MRVKFSHTSKIALIQSELAGDVCCQAGVLRPSRLPSALFCSAEPKDGFVLRGLVRGKIYDLKGGLAAVV